MILNVADVSAAYGRIEVLKGINLEVREGEIVSLLGANGAGKSTLLRVVSGLMHPHQGSISFQGTEIARTSPNEIVRLGLSHVPEGRQIFASLSVRQNLLLGGYVHRSEKDGAAKVLDFVFDLFPVLRARIAQKAGTLSGGEQQMLAVGRALMSQPKLLLLDEPSLGLAPLVVADIFKVVHELRASGLSILLVEQNVMSALTTSDRAYIMETGKIAIHGPARDMLGNDEVRRRYLGK
jgi:branched-chain amino acid transport system ATP-binding protein